PPTQESDRLFGWYLPRNRRYVPAMLMRIGSSSVAAARCELKFQCNEAWGKANRAPRSCYGTHWPEGMQDLPDRSGMTVLTADRSGGSVGYWDATHGRTWTPRALPLT